MSDKKTYIELNGIRYDAHTGKVLVPHAPEAQPLHHKPEASLPKPATVTGSGIIDGFSRRTTHTAENNLAHRPAKSDKTRSSAHSSKSLRPATQKSKTLMRPAVHKPVITKTQASPEPAAQKPLITNEHAARLKRAQTTKKSRIISRFYKSTAASNALIKRADTLPVITPPHTSPPATRVNAIAAIAQSSTQAAKHFEQAIQNSTSHLNQHHAKKKKPKRLTIISSSLIVVLLAGFFAYQNIPNVQMRVAATRAGFSASLPGYSPAGFGIAGPIKTEPGKVTISFKSRTDDKSFQVKQQVSEWSSTALLTNYVQKKSDPQAQTFPDERGRTLYIYGDSNVTWVDGGVWYDVAGDASLTDDQLLRIADSL